MISTAALHRAPASFFFFLFVEGQKARPRAQEELLQTSLSVPSWFSLLIPCSLLRVKGVVGPFNSRVCCPNLEKKMDSNARPRGRNWKQKRNEKASSVASATFEPGSIEWIFDGFRRQLDCQHDKHERLVKLSRDLTIASKRAIFSLQRANLSSKDSCAAALAEADKQLDATAGGVLRSLAEELRSVEARRYSSAYSPGMQEWVEARTLYQFVASRTLPGPAALDEYLRFDDGESQQLSLDLWPVDYLLGVADLGGELMRLAINSAASGNHEAPLFLRDFTREVQCHFAQLDWRAVPGRGLGSKYRVLRSTLEKMEMACYQLALRGSETVDMSGRMVEDLFTSASPNEDSMWTA